MTRLRLAHCAFAVALSSEALAVAIGDGPAFTYQTSAPNADEVENWDIGWGVTNATGWDYVGSIPGNGSAVYLGNNWVLTADHATDGTTTAGYFNLNGIRYYSVPGSRVGVAESFGRMTDLELFRISSAPGLPPLSIRTTAPEALDYFKLGSNMVFLGYGSEGRGKSWGAGRLTVVGTRTASATVGNTELRAKFGPYVVYDFSKLPRLPGDPPIPSRSVYNNARLASGDSGGGGFIFNPTASRWELAGINRAVNDFTSESIFVELDLYADRINQITGVPEPAPIGLIGLGLLALGWKLRSERVSSSREKTALRRTLSPRRQRT